MAGRLERVEGFYRGRGLGGEVEVVVSSPMGEPLARAVLTSPGRAREVVASLLASQEALASLRPGEVAGYLREASESLSAVEERLVETLVRDAGMSRRGAAEEVSIALEILGDPWPAVGGPGGAQALPGLDVGVRRTPGVGLVVAPYTSPLSAVAAALSFLLLNGIPAVVKPSMKAPLATVELVKAVASTALEPHVAMVLGAGGGLGSLLASDPRVSVIVSYTSPVTAASLWRQAWGRWVLANCMGRAAALVLPGADVEEAARAIAKSRFRHAGQACYSTAWVIVEKSVHEALVDALEGEVEKLRAGDPAKPGVDVGPLIGRYLVEKAARMVRDAQARGARVFQLGSPERSVYPPTVIDRTPKAAEVLDLDVQAPVLAVVPVESIKEAASMANSLARASLVKVYSYDAREVEDAVSRLTKEIAVVNPTEDEEEGVMLCTTPGNLPRDPQRLHPTAPWGITLRPRARAPPEEPY